MRFIPLPGVLLGLLASTACDDPDAASAPAGEVTDSAGIPIVTSAAADRIYARVADAPSLSIGELEGPDALLFNRIGTVARDREDNVIVADGGSDEIRVFDSGGNHIRTMGGSGDGPGEFRVLRGAWPLEDGTIAAFDSRLDRISRFGAMGEVAGATALRKEGFGLVTALGPAGSASLLLAIEEVPFPNSEEPVRATVSLLRHAVDGSTVDTVAQLEGAGYTNVTRTMGQNVMVELIAIPFSTGAAATASRDRIAFTLGDAYEVRFLDPAGALSHIVRLAESPRARTDEDLATYAQGSTRAELDEASLRDLVESYEGLPIPPALPGYVELKFADTGELWARRYGLPGAPMARWDVFDRDGHHLGHVEVPARFTVKELSRGQILGVARDDLDIERVHARDLVGS